MALASMCFGMAADNGFVGIGVWFTFMFLLPLIKVLEEGE
jgi:hypothetical protein